MAGSYVFQMTPGTAHDRATEISRYNEEIQTVVGKLKSMIEGPLREEWKGTAQDAYQTQFLALYNGPMKQFDKLLTEMALQLNSIANAVTQADSDIAAQIKKA